MENLQKTVRERPFEHGGRVTRAYFWDRSAEMLRLRSWYEGGEVGIIYGPRRVGKSSLADLVAQEMQAQKSLRFALVDVRETTEATFLARLAERVAGLLGERWNNRLQRVLADELRHFRHQPKISWDLREVPIKPALRFDRIPKDDEDLVLNDIFSMLERAPAAAGCPVALILDEFQDILTRSKLLPEVIKSRFKGGQGVSMVLTGSRQHLMDELTNSPSAALYRIGSMLSVGPLPREVVAEEMVKRFGWHRISLTDVAQQQIYELCEGVPKNLQWLGATLFDLARSLGWKGIDAAEVQSALSHLLAHEAGELYGLQWTELSEMQRQLAAAVAKYGGQGIFTSDFIDQVNPLRRVSQASVQRAARALLDKEVLEITPAGYAFKDPFFRLYAART